METCLTLLDCQLSLACCVTGVVVGKASVYSAVLSFRAHYGHRAAGTVLRDLHIFISYQLLFILRPQKRLCRHLQLDPAGLWPLTLYHSIFGAGLPVMMAVKVAGWPGCTHRSSWDTWTVGGAEEDIRSVRFVCCCHDSHIVFEQRHRL